MTCTSIQLTANVAGQTYDLNDGYNIRLLDYQLGLASTRRLFQRFPAQFGDSDLGGITEPRFVDIFWAIWGDTKAEYRTARETLLEIFRNRQTEAVQLVFTFEDGRQRAVDVHLDGELAHSETVGAFERISGTFKASDWRLYDPDLQVVNFSLFGTGGLPIPFTVPIPIGASGIDITETISYAVNSRLAAVEYPVIVISGPIDSPILENVTTAERIDLTGLSLAVGEFVTIDLAGGVRRDAKTIRNQDGDSVTQYLSVDSDLATWHLSFAGELLSNGTYSTGDNDVRVAGTGITLETAVSVRYYDRYEAI